MKLTDANMPVAKALLRQRWPDRATQIELLEVTNDTIICLECFPEDLRVQVTRVDAASASTSIIKALWEATVL